MNTSIICKYKICFPRFLGNKKYYSLQCPVNVGIFHVMMIFRIFCPSMCKVFTYSCLPFLRNHTFFGPWRIILYGSKAMHQNYLAVFVYFSFIYICLKEYLAHMEVSPLREKGLQNFGKCSVLTIAVSCKDSLNFSCLSRQESGTKDLFFIDL